MIFSFLLDDNLVSLLLLCAISHNACQGSSSSAAEQGRAALFSVSYWFWAAKEDGRGFAVRIKDRRDAVFSKLRAGAKACRVEERQTAFAVREGGLKGFEGIKP